MPLSKSNISAHALKKIGGNQDSTETGSSNWLFHIDYLLIVLVLLTTAYGLLVLDGATHDVPGLENYTRLQAKWWGVSIGVFFLALIVPYKWLKVLGWLGFFGVIVMLIMLAVSAATGLQFGGLVSKPRGGAVSWMKLPGIKGLVQPSEFAKIAVVVVMSHWLAFRRESMDRFWEVVPPLILTAIPVGLIIIQPDIGTASVFLPLPFLLLFLAGLRWKIVVAVILLSLMMMVAGFVYFATADEVPFLRSYQLKRIQVFIEPVTKSLTPLARTFRPPGVEEVLLGDNETTQENSEDESETHADTMDDWNIKQAEMALGSGRIFGKGWRQGTLSRWRFLPAHHTDFIFCALGEQFGAVGAVTLLGLYLLMLWRVVHISLVVGDFFGKLLVVGLISIVLLHVFLNIGMAIRLLPVTGVPLPLISYGGSFLATNYLIFGLIANVSMRR